VRFKEFLQETAASTEEFIHHLAEEELIACKIHKVEIEDKIATITADCKDTPRQPGLQSDLTEKLNNRLVRHKNLRGIKAKVYHEDIARDHFDTTPDRVGTFHPLNVIAK